MRILSRYFVARFLRLFAAILFAATLSIMVVEMLLNLDDMVGPKAGISEALGYLFLRIPSYYLGDLIPISSFSAALFCFGLASQELEVTASKAGGVSMLRIALPILVAASVLGVGTYFVNEALIIPTTRAFAERESGGESISFKRGKFWYHKGQTIYNIGAAQPRRKMLLDVSIYQLSPGGRLNRRVEAPRVTVRKDNEWHLEDALVRRFDLSNPGAPPVLKRHKQLQLNVGPSGMNALRSADPATLNTLDLREYIRLRSARGEPVQNLEAILYQRAVAPFTVVFLALLGIPLGLHVERTRSLTRPLLYGVAGMAAYYALRDIGYTMVTEGVAPAAPVSWTTVLLLGTVGTIALLRAPR